MLPKSLNRAHDSLSKFLSLHLSGGSDCAVRLEGGLRFLIIQIQNIDQFYGNADQIAARLKIVQSQSPSTAFKGLVFYDNFCVCIRRRKI